MTITISGIKGVIFDLDSTLIESLDAYTEAFNQAIKAHGLEAISKDQLTTFLNQAVSIDGILLGLFPDVFGEASLRQKAVEEMRRVYLQLEGQGVGLVSGAKETLSWLKSNQFKIGIVTSRPTSGEIQWVELSRLDVAQFIDAMVTAAEVPRKPAPDGIIKCLEMLDLSPDECVFVGDAQADIDAGKGANVQVITLGAGVAQKYLTNLQEVIIIEKLAELVTIIEER